MRNSVCHKSKEGKPVKPGNVSKERLNDPGDSIARETAKLAQV